MVMSVPGTCFNEESADKITLPARFSSLSKVRKFVVAFAAECGLMQVDIDSVELAVDEAFSNIIEHSYGGESGELIECACLETSDRILIILKDCGKPFDPDIIPDPDLNATLEERKIGGLGMYFMSRLMDNISYSFTTGPGGTPNCNALTLEKYKR